MSYGSICNRLNAWYELIDDIDPYLMVLITILSLSVLPIISLNTLILTAIARTPTLRTPSNILTCNLAAANLGIALIGIPFGVAWKFLKTYHDDNDVICGITVFGYSSSGFFNGGSFLILVLATLDRYLALIFHLRYPLVVSNGRVVFSCIVAWITSLTHILLILVGMKIYYIVASILIIIVLTIIVFCCTKIFTVVRRHHNQIASQTINITVLPNMTRYRKSVMNLLHVICFQFAFLAPYMASLVYFVLHGVTTVGMKFWTISTCLLFLNSFVNPLIICMRYRELRTAIKDTARSFCRRSMETIGWRNRVEPSVVY